MNLDLLRGPFAWFGEYDPVAVVWAQAAPDDDEDEGDSYSRGGDDDEDEEADDLDDDDDEGDTLWARGPRPGRLNG